MICYNLPSMTASTPTNQPASPNPTRRARRLPPWLKRPVPAGSDLLETRKLVRGLRLNTVCVEARCPNLSECWGKRTATFMILGDHCTRNCRFCAVSAGPLAPPAADEPRRLVEATRQLGLRHVVITSVTRDDLPDEGATHFAHCIQAVHNELPDVTVEVLTPDFHARRELIEQVLTAHPNVFNHNVETVPRLHPTIRPEADYFRSLQTLRLAREIQPKLVTKSGIMVGLGESADELLAAFGDLRDVGCRLLTIGQYLQPSHGTDHAPVARFYEPHEFRSLGDAAKQLGFAAVASGPFVRSSYFAENLYRDV